MRCIQTEGHCSSDSSWWILGGQRMRKLRQKPGKTGEEWYRFFLQAREETEISCAFLKPQPKWVKEGDDSSRESFCFFCHSLHFLLWNFSHSGTFCSIWHLMLMQGRVRKTGKNCVSIDGNLTSWTSSTPEWCVAKANSPVGYTYVHGFGLLQVH